VGVGAAAPLVTPRPKPFMLAGECGEARSPALGGPLGPELERSASIRSGAGPLLAPLARFSAGADMLCTGDDADRPSSSSSSDVALRTRTSLTMSMTVTERWLAAASSRLTGDMP
jgi:hypothetical protein